MKGLFSKQEDSGGLLLWLARPPAYAGALVLYGVAVCVASVLAHGRRSPLIVVAGPLTRPACPWL